MYGGGISHLASAKPSAYPAYFRQTVVPRSANSDSDSTQITLSVDFPVNLHTVSPEFSNNAVVLDSLKAIIDRAVSDETFTLYNIKIDGAASPDGRYNSNMRLAKRRMLSLCYYISSNFNLPDGVTVSPGRCFVAWPEFRDAVRNSNIANADIILQISEEGDDESTADSDIRLRKLKKLNNGRTWRILAADILPQLRNAVGITLSSNRIPVEPAPEPAPEPEPQAEPVNELTSESEQVQIQEPTPATEPILQIMTPECPIHQWHLGTNALEWALAIANLTGEYDFAARWSVALSLHYSAWNYGKATRKFRTFIFRPEVRYWFSDCHKGFFINAHVQMAAYNFALPGWEYRIQDVDGKNPALGGGVGLGYRVHLDRNRRWSFQAELGVGVYHLRYDRFENRYNGPLFDSKSRVWAGIDHVGLSLIYNFKSRKQ